MDLTQLQEQLVAEMVECLKVFLNASHNFSQHFKTLSITEFERHF